MLINIAVNEKTNLFKITYVNIMVLLLSLVCLLPKIPSETDFLTAFFDFYHVRSEVELFDGGLLSERHVNIYYVLWRPVVFGLDGHHVEASVGFSVVVRHGSRHSRVANERVPRRTSPH